MVDNRFDDAGQLNINIIYFEEQKKEKTGRNYMKSVKQMQHLEIDIWL